VSPRRYTCRHVVVVRAHRREDIIRNRRMLVCQQSGSTERYTFQMINERRRDSSRYDTRDELVAANGTTALLRAESPGATGRMLAAPSCSVPHSAFTAPPLR